VDKKRFSLCLISVVILTTAFTAGLAFGSIDLGISGIIDGLTGRSETESIIITELRIPRVTGAALAGAALACAGLILQCVTGNGLCAPNIMGINAGAGFMVMVLLCFFPAAWRLLPGAAFIGTVCTTSVILLISSGGRHHSSATLILSGVAVSAILNAGISFLSIRFPDVLSSYVAFSVGGFSGIGFDDIAVPAVITAVSLAGAAALAPKMDLLCLGDDLASSLGVRVRLLRTLCLLISSALCAAAVSFAGLLGFVGLVVPHIVRRLAGNKMGICIPICGLLGGSLVILADLAGRTLFAPSEIPAGVFMALIGTPFFLRLLIKRRDGIDGM